jgi:hypothetical protein
MKSLLLKIKLFILSLLVKAEVYIPIGISVVNKIKTFIDSPAADIITAIIPGTLDDAVKVWLRQYLPVILKDFGDIETIIHMTPAARNQVYLGIAANINMGLTNALSKESITLAQSVLATQYTYNETSIIPS